jgi:hypothetical protein
LKTRESCMDCANHYWHLVHDDDELDEFMQKHHWDLVEKYNTDEVCGHFNPEYWKEKEGYEINWGDADLNGHRIKINMLKKTVDGKTEYMLLIPEFLRRPAHYGNGHGDY